MTDLNSLIDSASGWTLENAEAINNSGEIVGYGSNTNSGCEAFLLTPVPEPTSLVLIGAAAFSLFRFVLRRRK
jgi:probable HAF family extracellular repeat protein